MSHITVRHVVPEDASALHQLYSQPETYSDTLQLPHPSLMKWRERLAAIPEGTQMLVACIDGQIVGQASVYLNTPARRRHSASFGLGVDVTHRGKGVASALLRAMLDLCDNWLGVDRVELTVFADNQAAIGLYEKFGFITEGHARRFAIRNGQQVDALFMARLRS